MKIDNLSKEFVKDLIPLVNSLGNLVKTASVSYKSTKFNYVPLDDIMARIKDNGNFAFMQPLGTMEDGTPCITCMLIHKSGEMMVSEPYKLRIAQGATKQTEGAEITYSRRYSASSFFGIASDDDSDATDQKPQSNKPSLLSQDTRDKLNAAISDYKKLTGRARIVPELETIIGKPLANANEADARKLLAAVSEWSKKYVEEMETA